MNFREISSRIAMNGGKKKKKIMVKNLTCRAPFLLHNSGRRRVHHVRTFVYALVSASLIRGRLQQQCVRAVSRYAC